MGPACTIVNFGRSVLFLSFLVIHQRVLSDLTCKPVDSESLVYESTYFNCSSSITGKEIHWYHYPVGVEAYERKSVYANGKFYKDYEEDFVLEKNSSYGAYNLVIRSVKTGYAGRYECQDNGGLGNSCFAQLIVLDEVPECKSNINPYGVIGPNACGIQPDELHLSCSVAYHGNIAPELKWIKLGENDSISENVTKGQTTTNRITYNLTTKADLLKDKTSYECQITKSRTSKHSCSSETVKLLYFYNASSVSVKNIGEVVNCSANTSSQSCQYKWKWYNKEDLLTVSDNQILKVEKEGQHRCEATCNLQNVPCTVNAILINATQNSNSNGSGTIDSSGSSATTWWVIFVVLFCVLVVVLLFTLFIIRRRKHGLKGICCVLFKTLEAEEKRVEGATPLIEIPMQDASLKSYGIPDEPYQEKEMRKPEDEKKVKDGTNPVTENFTEEGHPLLQIPGDTETNPIVVSDNDDDQVKDGKRTREEEEEEEEEVEEKDEEEKPGKRKKTEEPKNEDIIDYDLNPTLLHIEKLNSAEEMKTPISGLMVLDKELFIAFEHNSEVKVFQAITFSLVRSFVVMELGNPLDMVSSPVSKCLYISSPYKIYRVDANGNVIAKWSIEDGGGTLSVTRDQTVILSDWKRSSLRDYSADGKLIHEVRLPSDVHPFHAVKTIDQFVVSLERRMVHDVCIVGLNGTFIQSFGGMLKFPKYLTVNSDGYIFVADQKNSRVLMMDPTLTSSKVLLSDKDELGRPWRIFLDEKNNLMFVADNKAENHRFMVFKLEKHKTGAKEDIAMNQARPLESNRNLKEDSNEIEDNSVSISDNSDNEEENDEFKDAKESLEESRGEEFRPGKRKR